MAATVLVREKNTVSETATDKTSATIRFKKADNATVDAVNPLVKPTAGNDRSYEKWLRLNFSVGPTGSITAPKFYSDGSSGYGTGISLFVRTTNPGTFSTPAIPSDDSAGTDVFTYTSASSKAIDAVNAGPFSGTGDKADYVVLWMTLATTVSAPQNPTASETYTLAWDET